jgi:hypothetical protein
MSVRATPVAERLAADLGRAAAGSPRGPPKDTGPMCGIGPAIRSLHMIVMPDLSKLAGRRQQPVPTLVSSRADLMATAPSAQHLSARVCPRWPGI